MNELPPNAVYLAYHGVSDVDNLINIAYNKFKENLFPKYINKDELKFEIRRRVTMARYSPNDGRTLTYPVLQFTLKPILMQLSINTYEGLKRMGII